VTKKNERMKSLYNDECDKVLHFANTNSSSAVCTQKIPEELKTVMEVQMKNILEQRHYSKIIGKSREGIGTLTFNILMLYVQLLQNRSCRPHICLSVYLSIFVPVAHTCNIGHP
jgi:hypothetical protein